MNRYRRGRNGQSRLASKLVTVSIVVLVVLAYSGGVSHAHWTTQTLAQVDLGTGSLGVDVSDPPEEFRFTCVDERPIAPEHPISFIRFWDPAMEPGDLVSWGSGAVKIEEDRIELGSGNYSVGESLTQLGDLGPNDTPVALNLDGVVVEITGWMEHPDLPGRYIGFSYETDGTDVVVDVKASESIWRITLTGSGMWSLDAVDRTDHGDEGRGDDDNSGVVCDATSLAEVFTISNSGSIPSAPHLGLSTSTGDGGNCSLYDVTLTAGEPGEVIFDGSLCALLGPQIQIAQQVDPGESVDVTMEVSLVEPIPSDDQALEFHDELVAEVVLVQWNSGAPGSQDDFGWSESAIWDVDLWLTIELGDERAPVVDVPAVEPPTADPPTEEPPAANPPAEELPTDDPPADDPPVDDPPADDSPGADPPAAPPLASLAGHVWSDLDGDWVTVRGGAEEGVGSAVVVLLDEKGNEVARVETDEDGDYLVADVEPGNYSILFIPPEGYGFVDATEEIPTDHGPFIEELAVELGVAVDEIVVADVVEFDFDDTLDGWMAKTGLIAVAPGDNVGPADAALTVIPVEETDPAGEADDGVVVATNPNAVTTEPDEQPAIEEGITVEAETGEGADDLTESVEGLEPDPLLEGAPDTESEGGESAETGVVEQ